MIYLDAAATTPVRREVLEAMWPFLTGEFGNASSQHTLGKRAAHALVAARETVARVLSCRPAEIVFTSGGTESDNFAIKGTALAAPRGRHIVISAIEHEAVLASCDYLRRHHGFEITEVGVDHEGKVHPETVAAALRDDTTLCSVMLANNEVGTVQPIAEIAALLHANATPMHTDAVQAAGALPLHVGELGVDAMSLSGHKIGGPKGVGALYLRRGLPVEPVIHGGGQERGRRSGTENIAGVVGFARALELASIDLAVRSHRLAGLRNELIAGVLEQVPGAVLTGHAIDRLPGNASFCFPQVSGEALLLQLEERGVVCSSGSACAAGRDEPSHVLLNMGYPREVAQTAIRFTLPETIELDQIREIIHAISESYTAVASLRTGTHTC